MSTSKVIKAYITDLNGNRITGTYISDTVTTLTYDGQTYTRNAQTGRSFAIAKDGDYFVAYLYNPDEAVSDGLVATFEGDLQWSDAPVLPTVTQYRKSLQYTGTQIDAGGSQFLVDGRNKISYDTSVTYGFNQWVLMTTVQRTPGEIINNAGFVAVKNTSSSAVTGAYNVDYATCSSNHSELVTVYNSSNVAYNAFKYTASGTDYYYVLDGTQTDWTDDLASIGYSLTPAALTAYLDTPNNTQSLPMVGDGVSYTYVLYDTNGNWLSTNNNYTMIGYHATVDGPLLSLDRTGVYLLKDTMYGRTKITSNGAQRISIQRIEYTVS